MHTPNKSFAVTYITREDIKKECPEIDLRKVSDEDMERLADEMGDALSECYWQAMRDFVEILDFPKCNSEKK